MHAYNGHFESPYVKLHILPNGFTSEESAYIPGTGVDTSEGATGLLVDKLK